MNACMGSAHFSAPTFYLRTIYQQFDPRAHAALSPASA